MNLVVVGNTMSTEATTTLRCFESQPQDTAGQLLAHFGRRPCKDNQGLQFLHPPRRWTPSSNHQGLSEAARQARATPQMANLQAVGLSVLPRLVELSVRLFGLLELVVAVGRVRYDNFVMQHCWWAV